MGVRALLVLGLAATATAGSGSLVVTDPDREAVGLLFAGNNRGSLGIANPITVVLDAFGNFWIVGE